MANLPQNAVRLILLDFSNTHEIVLFLEEKFDLSFKKNMFAFQNWWNVAIWF